MIDKLRPVKIIPSSIIFRSVDEFSFDKFFSRRKKNGTWSYKIARNLEAQDIQHNYFRIHFPSSVLNFIESYNIVEYNREVFIFLFLSIRINRYLHEDLKIVRARFDIG